MVDGTLVADRRMEGKRGTCHGTKKNASCRTQHPQGRCHLLPLLTAWKLRPLAHFLTNSFPAFYRRSLSSSLLACQPSSTGSCIMRTRFNVTARVCRASQECRETASSIDSCCTHIGFSTSRRRRNATRRFLSISFWYLVGKQLDELGTKTDVTPGRP